jgi:four helix bundle protein
LLVVEAGMVEKTGFERLEVYVLSERISDLIWKLVTGWNSLARDTIGKQMIRAVDSIGANLAEGSGRGTYKDNCNFVNIARGSLYETRHWLRRAFSRGLLSQQQIDALTPLIAELTPKLNAFRRSLKVRIAADAARPRKSAPRN